MKTFRLSTFAVAFAAALTLGACSSNSSSVKSGTAGTSSNATPNIANSGSNTNTNANSGSSTNTSTNSGSSTNTNTNSGSNTNTSTNSGSSTNTSTNSGSNTNTSTNSGSSTNTSTNLDSTSKLAQEIAKGFGGANGTMSAPETFTNANGEDVIRFAADVVSINKDGSLKHQNIGDDKRGASSKSFTLNNTRINLLNNSWENQSTEGGIAVRQMKQNEFDTTDGNGTVVGDAVNPLHATNPSWVGSVAANSVNQWGEESNNTGSFKNLRYGVYNDADGNSHLFVFGLPARMNITSGTINYAGSAIVGKDGKYDGLGNAMTATANFDTKKVDVEIKRDAGNLQFGGDIKGNTFEGTQNNIYTKGGFYGTSINATSRNSNLGGMFTIIDGAEKGLNGVYGGAQK